jgi:hypothetical protein
MPSLRAGAFPREGRTNHECCLRVAYRGGCEPGDGARQLVISRRRPPPGSFPMARELSFQIWPKVFQAIRRRIDSDLEAEFAGGIAGPTPSGWIGEDTTNKIVGIHMMNTSFRSRLAALTLFSALMLNASPRFPCVKAVTSANNRLLAVISSSSESPSATRPAGLAIRVYGKRSLLTPKINWTLNSRTGKMGQIGRLSLSPV